MHKNGAVCKVLTELYVNSELTHGVDMDLSVQSPLNSVQCELYCAVSGPNSTVQKRVSTRLYRV